MKLDEAKAEFIQAWGTLGTSWGINKAMAQIHALLIISPDPLTTDDIMEELKISRGNANMNIRALIDWGIVHKIFVRGERKEYFASEKDIYALARRVAFERKKRELDPISKLLNNLQSVKGSGKSYDEFMKVTSDLKDFSNDASTLLDKFISHDKKWFYKVVRKLI